MPFSNRGTIELFSRVKKKLRPSHVDAEPVTPTAQDSAESALPINSSAQPPESQPTTTLSPPDLPILSLSQPGSISVSQSPPPSAPLPTINQATSPSSIHESDSPPLSVPERLWTKAYDSIKEKEPNRVKAYEEIIENIKNEWGNIPENEMEDLEHCKTDKSRQMWMVVYMGLERSKKMAHYKEIVSNNIGIIGNLKGVIDQAVKASPEAGVAWAGISVGLEWYWNLANIILDAERANANASVLRSKLESQVVEFYKKLLLFQIHSACLYYRNWASVLLRDTLKLDDWDEKLKDVKEAESNLRQDFEQYNTEEMKLWLSGIVNIAKSQEALLENICASIQQEARARERREQEERDTKNMECFAAFQLTDPQLDKIEIQKRKGAPLWDSYSWVLQHDAYNKLDDSSSRVLWINGEPGKGKTMLLCGIIDELKKSLRPVSYFFCQVTDEDLSNDTAVIRGLIYVLLDQQPSLISEVRPYYDKRKDKLFSGKNSNVLLSEILTKLLQDPSMQNAVLVVGALDECKSGRDRLITLIGDLSRSCSARWIISSRNWPEIARGLRDTKGLVPLELENNTELVAGAVQAYIQTRVDHLGKNWDNDTHLKREVFDYMVSRADNTFLWVALVCESLSDSRISKRLVLEELKRFPEGLNDLFSTMMDKIVASLEADRLKSILATACIAYRPLTSKEMINLVESMTGYDEHDVKDAIESCACFLAYRDGVIFFVHQSAKEFLFGRGIDKIMPSGPQNHHTVIFSRSMEVLEDKLQQDVYQLKSPGTLVDEISKPDPDPLPPIKYLCTHWVDHFINSDSVSTQDDKILAQALQFLMKKFTSWLEATSLLRVFSVAIKSILKLESALSNIKTTELARFVQDARGFILYHKEAIDTAPLQVYASALLFSPKCSKIRNQFHRQTSKWVVTGPEMQDDWEALVRTTHIIEIESSIVSHSPDGKFLASVCKMKAVVYDTMSGDCMFSINRDFSQATSVAFSPLASLLAVGSTDKVEIFDLGTRTVNCIAKLDVRADLVVFLPVDKQLATLENDEELCWNIWNWNTGEHLQSIVDPNEFYVEATFLPHGRMITVSDNETAKVWNIATGRCEQALEGHSDQIVSMACSSDGKRLATGSWDCTVKVWHTSVMGDWICERTLYHENAVHAVLMSPDGRILVSADWDHCIRIWNDAGIWVKTLNGHIKGLNGLSLHENGQWLVSSTKAGYMMLWDISPAYSSSASQEPCGKNGQEPPCQSTQFFDGDTHLIERLSFSPQGEMIVAHLKMGRSKIWNVASGSCIAFCERPRRSHSLPIFDWITFARNDRLIGMPVGQNKAIIWDLDTNARTYLFTNVPRAYRLMHLALSPDGRYAATGGRSAILDSRIEIWDLTGTELIKRPTSLVDRFDVVLFSNDSKFLTSFGTSLRDTTWEVDFEAPVEGEDEIQGVRMDVSRDLQRNLLCRASEYFPRISVEMGVPVHSCLSLENASLHSNTGSHVVTWLGIMDAHKLQEGEEDRVGWGLSVDMRWVMRGNERILWIPVDLPVAIDAVHSRVTIGLPSGRITMMELA
ncbi:hypothetical protein NW765_015978 [Fusarium oxysporum]|nr:hypothetical protein NW765_015978 [Fusarium oxysporum]KAJ4281048.1 hypothetical protein NW764_005391 [Fusarium oxysporum]